MRRGGWCGVFFVVVFDIGSDEWIVAGVVVAVGTCLLLSLMLLQLFTPGNHKNVQQLLANLSLISASLNLLGHSGGRCDGGFVGGEREEV